MALTRENVRKYDISDFSAIIAGSAIFEGAAVGAVKTSGIAVVGTFNPDLHRFSGFAKNNAIAGDYITIQSKGRIILPVAGANDTSVNAIVYAIDDDTFGLTATGISIGRIAWHQGGGLCVVGFDATSLEGSDGNTITDIDVVTNATTKAAANTTDINARIVAGGSFSITTPGIVWINSTLRVPSNTDIYIGAATTVKLIDGVGVPILENYNYDTAPLFTLSAGELTYNPATLLATCAHTGIGASFPVGSYITVLKSSTTWFCGVFGPITASSANSVSWLMERPPAANTALGTITISVADYNIKIWGTGKIDPNRAGTTANPATLKTYGTRWFKTAHLKLDDYTIVASQNYANSVCAFYKFRTSGVKVFNHVTQASDAFHVSSPGRGMRLRDLVTNEGDNSIGLLALGLSATGSPVYEPVWCGELDDIEIDGVNNVLNTATSIVGMWGDSSSRFGKVKIKKLRGSSLAEGITLNPYTLDGCNWTTVQGDELIVEDIDLRLPTGGTSVYMGGQGDWNKVTVDGVNLNGPGIFYQLFQPTSNTIGELTIRNLSSPITRDEDAIRMTNGATVTVMNIEDTTMKHSGGAYGFMTSAAQISTFNHRNLNLANTGTGRFFQFNTYLVTTINLSNIRVVGNYGFVGGLNYITTDVSAGALINTINVTNSYCETIDCLLSLPNTNQTQSIAINLANVTMYYCLSGVRSGAPTTIKAVNVTELTPAAGASPLFTYLTSGKAYNLNLSNVEGVGSLVSVAAGALLRASGGTFMKMNGDLFTGTPLAADSFWNTLSTSTFGTGTSKIGLYGYTGAAWTKIFGPA